jgi:signal peptide peptidase SppA
MIRHHLHARLIGIPIAVEPVYFEAALSVLSDRLDIAPIVNADAAQRYTRPARSGYVDKVTGIAVLPIVGSLAHRVGGIEAASGVVGYTALQAALTALLDNPNVRGILLDIDSPGGEVAGLIELCEWIRAAKAEKPIWALANATMASAAYWLASAATRIIAAPASRVGSIGVVTAHVDRSKEMQKRGQAVTFIHAGAHKVDGHAFAPLPDPVRDAIQSSVDELYSQFVTAVATNRGIEEKSIRATEAKMFGPQAAIEAGLIDAVGTFGEAMLAFAEYLDNGAPASTDTRQALRPAMGSSGAVAKAELISALTEVFPTSRRAAIFTRALAGGVDVLGATDIALNTPEDSIIAAIGQVVTSGDVDRAEAVRAIEILFTDVRGEVFADVLNDGANVEAAARVALRTATALNPDHANDHHNQVDVDDARARHADAAHAERQQRARHIANAARRMSRTVH